MAIKGDEPISAANVAAALGVSTTTSGTAEKPISAENLRNLFDRLGVSSGTTLVGEVLHDYRTDGVEFEIPTDSLYDYACFAFERPKNGYRNPAAIFFPTVLYSPGTYGNSSSGGYIGVPAHYNIKSNSFVTTEILVKDYKNSSGVTMTKIKCDRKYFTRLIAYKYLRP